MSHFAWLCIEAHVQHLFLDIVDVLGRLVGLIAIIFILDSVINPLKVIFNGHRSVQFPVKSLMILLEVYLFNYSVSVHYIMVISISLTTMNPLYLLRSSEM